MANTVTLSKARTQATSSATSVVFGNDTSSHPHREDTPTIGPVRPPSRHASLVRVSRFSEGTSTSRRPARSSSALRAVFLEPAA